MSYHINYDEAIHIISVHVVGEFNLLVLQSLAGEVGKVVKQHHCHRILNDMRQATITPDAFDIYKMPKTAQTQGIKIVFRRALVVGKRFKEFRFLETVFVNRGHIVKLFNEPEAAIAWLTENNG